jgi:hypothetical protein
MFCKHAVSVLQHVYEFKLVLCFKDRDREWTLTWTRAQAWTGKRTQTI